MIRTSDALSDIVSFPRKAGSRMRDKLIIKTEGEGFEPSIPFGILAFQASALDHYANLPF